MKIYINKPNEDWICDRLRNEFYKNLPEICTEDISEANIVWLMAPWIFRKIKNLSGKKVISTIHHIDPEKFNHSHVFRFEQFVNFYHAPSYKSECQIKEHTPKEVVSMPWWINNEIWTELDKNKCRKDLELPVDKFIIGSFQRDTEGNDLKTPKLSKGPDRFCDIVEDMHKSDKDIHVLLGGWRRQYIINRLKSSNIPYTFIERPPFEVLNKMYNALDLYIVGSRCEGEPQSIPEYAATKTPIISTNVGCAEVYLSPKSIFNFPDYKESSPDCDFAFEKAKEKFIPDGFNPYVKMFEDLFSL